MSMRSLLASVAVACVAASASAELEITEICARCQSKVPVQKDGSSGISVGGMLPHKFV